MASIGWKAGLGCLALWIGGLYATAARADAVTQAPQATAPASSWRLVWSDEFNANSLDPTKWGFDRDCWGGGNKERQCYTDRPENVQVANGLLSIIARKETVTGPALPPHLAATADPSEKDKQVTKEYSSARLTTKGKADWRYGRIEVRARPPKGQGTWAAVWMLPTEDHYGPWAASGEIDIMEAANLGTKCRPCAGGVENRIHGTIHFGGVWPRNTYKGQDAVLPPSEDGFHVYAVQWEEGRIVWLLDGKPYGVKTYRDWHTEAPKARQTLTAPSCASSQSRAMARTSSQEARFRAPFRRA